MISSFLDYFNYFNFVVDKDEFEFYVFLEVIYTISMLRNLFDKKKVKINKFIKNNKVREYSQSKITRVSRPIRAVRYRVIRNSTYRALVLRYFNLNAFLLFMMIFLLVLCTKKLG